MEAQVTKLALALAGLSVSAAAQNVTVWRDSAGNMVVRNLSSWRATRQSENTIVFKGLGSPFEATWKEQGLTVRAASMEGTAQKDEKGAYQLHKAAIQDVASATIEETVNGSVRTTELRCKAIQYDGVDSKAQLTGPVRIVSRVPAQSQSLEITGSVAQLALTPIGEKSEWPLRSATIEGPITMRLDSVERDPAGKAEPRKVQVTGKASRASFNDAARTVTLTGKVELEGSDSLIGAEVKADRVVITLNERREIVDIEFSGNPGQSRLRDGGSR
jgi:lipopolysaccharide export system protein LptA